MSIIDRVYKLIEYKGFSVNEFSKIVGVSNGYFAKQRSVNANIGSQIIEKIVREFPEISLEWLIIGDGQMIKSGANVIPINTNESETHISIPIINVSAAAGTGSFNDDHIETIDEIKLPIYLVKRNQTYRCVKVKGHSMAPTLQDSSYIVIRAMDKSEWKHMPNEHVYMIIDREGHSYVKRVRNRFERGFIVCTSDNIDKSNFQNFNLNEDEIHDIWHVEWYFTAKMDNINNSYYTRMTTIENELDDIKTILDNRTLNEWKNSK